MFGHGRYLGGGVGRNAQNCADETVDVGGRVLLDPGRRPHASTIVGAFATVFASGVKPDFLVAQAEN